MNGYDADIEILLSMERPTDNRITDFFGVNRHWGKHTWSPSRNYSPIHAGVDFSAMPGAYILAPVHCMAWGDKREPGAGLNIPEAVGSYVMMRPIGRKGPSSNIALYFFHCEPTGRKWQEFGRGEVMTKHAGHGIGAPHLHFEVSVTEGLGRSLIDEGLMKEQWVTLKEWRVKASLSGLDFDGVLPELQNQMKRWGIRGVYHDYLVDSTVPAYKKSDHSRIGKGGYTYVIDPLLFIGNPT